MWQVELVEYYTFCSNHYTLSIILISTMFTDKKARELWRVIQTSTPFKLQFWVVKKRDWMLKASKSAAYRMIFISCFWSVGFPHMNCRAFQKAINTHPCLQKWKSCPALHFWSTNLWWPYRLNKLITAYRSEWKSLLQKRCSQAQPLWNSSILHRSLFWYWSTLIQTAWIFVKFYCVASMLLTHENI